MLTSPFLTLLFVNYDGSLVITIPHSRACHYLTNCRWRQGGAEEAPTLREGSTKAPRRLHEATMVEPRATTEAPRRPRERSMTPARRIHFVDAPATQMPKGRFHSESVIPSAQPHVVSIFEFGLGLGLELRLCKKMSTVPPRRHHGCFVKPWRHHGCFTEPSRSHRQFAN